MSSTQLLMLPSDTYKEDTLSCTIEKYGASKPFLPNGKSPSPKPRTPISSPDNSSVINDQRSIVSSETSSLQSSDQFEFEELPTWTLLPLADEGSVTSPDNSDNELHLGNEGVEFSDVDQVPRKRQKIQTGSITGNAQITTDVRVKPRDKISTFVDSGSMKRKLPRLQNFATLTALAVDSADTRVIHAAIPEPPRKSRGLALRSTNSSYITKLKKSGGHIADQATLESWTNADIAHVRFRKPDELKVLEEVEEENARRNARHILKSLMDMEAESSNKDVARHEETISNCVQNQVAMPDSSVYTRCDNLVEKIFGSDNRNQRTKPKTVPSISIDELEIDERKFLETPSEASSEWTKPIKNIPVDQFGVDVTSDIEEKKVENSLKRQHSSITNDEGQEEEETRDDADSPQVPLPYPENWSTTLRSLIKGKKRFQHQDLIELKDTLQEIYNNRANISATSSLAQEVYEVSQLEVHDVPNQDELRFRALARKSTQYWGIQKVETSRSV